MPNTKDISETEAQTIKLWPVLCAFITGVGMAVFCSTVWGRTPKPSTLLFTVATIAVGAVLGLILRRTKKARNTSLVISIAFFVLFFALGRYMVSDAALVKKEWPVHNIGLTTFAYPSDFSQKTLPQGFLQNGEVSIFTNENTKRYACYMVYTFTNTYPELEDSLSNAVLSMLSSFGAQFGSWEQQGETDFSEGEIKTRFTYTLQDKKYTGIAYATSHITDAQHARYELLMFFPLRKKYSKAFIERIENEIYRSM